MRKLQPQEIEQIAIHYMELNSRPGDSVEQLYSLYASAVDSIDKIESDAFKEHISSPDWGF